MSGREPRPSRWRIASAIVVILPILVLAVIVGGWPGVAIAGIFCSIFLAILIESR